MRSTIATITAGILEGWHRWRVKSLTSKRNAYQRALDEAERIQTASLLCDHVNSDLRAQVRTKNPTVRIDITDKRETREYL